MLFLALWAGYKWVEVYRIHSSNKPHLLIVCLIEENFLHCIW